MRRALAVLLFLSSLPLLAAQPSVSTITPAAGLVGGGTIVHFHGSNLLTLDSVNCFFFQTCSYVKFGDGVGTIIYDSPDEIVAVAPPHGAGPVDVVLGLGSGNALNTVTVKSAFNYQDPGDTNVRLLLPIATGTQGILNTSWQTDVLAHNETPSPVVIAGTTIPPLATQKLALSPTSTGMFLEIPRSVFEGVTITTHVHDTTHDAESLGVDVPSVPETQFRRSVVLPGVPNDGRYRVLLRVYGYPGVDGLIVRVRDDATGELLSSQSFLVVASDLAYLQVPVSAPQTSHALRVEVTTGEQSPIWAFLTLTNNTTENVTLITPSVAVAPEAPATDLLQGHWGHAGVCMEVDQSNKAGVTVGCGSGTFQLTEVVAPDGRFEADGQFGISAGPVPPNPVLPPAHFSGFVRNGTLALTIRTATQTIGPFTLIYGSTDPCSPACP